jgi:hypothetical protein
MNTMGLPSHGLLVATGSDAINRAARSGSSVQTDLFDINGDGLSRDIASETITSRTGQ